MCGLVLSCIKIKFGPKFSAYGCTIAGKKVGHQISVSFEKFDIVQALLSFFFDTIPADSLKIYFSDEFLNS
jgi:hypothetical protein